MNAANLRVLSLAAILMLAVVQADAREFNVSGSVFYRDGKSVQLTPDPGPAGRPRLDPSTVKSTPGQLVRVIIRRTSDNLTVGAGYTDSRGVFSVAVNASPGDPLRIQFEGNNYASRIWANMDCANDQLLGQGSTFAAPAGGNVDTGVQFFFLFYVDITSGRCVFDADYTSTVSFSAAVNINNAVLAARQYADANRHPDEGDSIPMLEIEYCNVTWNSYRGDMAVTCYHSPELSSNGARVDYGYQEETLIHEFGHHLQANIAAKNGWVFDAKHFFCTQYNGGVEDRAGFVFKEGWPNYLAAWIIRENPEMEPPTGSPEAPCVSNDASLPPLERGTAGSGVTFVDSSNIDRWKHVEDLVTGFLFDLADERGSDEDAWDLVDGPAINGHRQIFHILDRELDRDFIVLDTPDLDDFYEAWWRHNGDDLEDGWRTLDLILNGVGITPKNIFGLQFPPTGIIGAIPGAGTTGMTDLNVNYDPLTNDLLLRSNWSSTRSANPANRTSIKTFVSNIGPANARWLTAHPVQAAGEGANGATFDVGPILFSTLASIGGVEPTDWLTEDLGFLPGLVLPKRVLGFWLDEENSVKETMPRGTYLATVPVDFEISTFDSATILQARNVFYELRIRDTLSDDNDRDGLSNQLELSIDCLDPNHPDSDRDGISDGDERNIFGTSPCRADTDGDGQSDGDEIRLGCSNPRNPAEAVAGPEQDADGDGWTNAFENSFGTDPCDADTDGDTIIDSIDNCPTMENLDQRDADEDGDGDACDTDVDGDGVPGIIDLDDTDPDIGLPPEISRLEDMFVDVGIHDGFFRRALPPLPLPFPEPEAGDRRFFSDDGTIGEMALTDAALNDLALITGKDFGLPPVSGFAQAISLLPDQDGDGTNDMAVAAPWAGAGVVFLLSGVDGSMIQRFDAPFGVHGFGTAMALIGENTLAISAPGDADLPGSIHTLNLQDRELTNLMTDIHPGGEFGTTLVPLIDMDQDGLVELAVGAPGADHPIYPQGAVYLVSTGTSAEFPSVIGTGDHVGSHFGESMTSIGDINADTLPELFVGAPFASGPAPDADPLPIPTDSITASANGGAPEAGLVRLLSVDGDVHWTRYGERAFDHLGTAVTVISNGFGPMPYLLLGGAPDEDNNGTVDAGAVHFFEPATGRLEFALHGDFEGGRLGRHLSVGVDRASNGFPAFAVTEQMLSGGEIKNMTRFVELPDAPKAANHDADEDNVPDTGDVCRSTVIPEVAITIVGTNRWALLDNDFEFDTSGKNNKNQGFSTTETAGCSCEQIVDILSLGKGHLKHGCSNGIMKSWIGSVN